MLALIQLAAYHAAMGLIDGIIVVLVLAFVVSRFLGFKLPKDPRSGKERRMDWEKLRSTFSGEDAKDVTPAKSGVKSAAKDVGSRVRPAKAKRVDVSGLSGVEQIKALDEGFDEQRFKEGTAAAYKYFVECWVAQDEEGLEKLCAPELMNQLRVDMESYNEREVKPWLADVSVVGVEVVGARVVGRSAIVEAEVTAKQREGEIAADEDAPADMKAVPLHEVRVRWVLARPLASDDPNWELQQIEPVGGRA